MSTTYTVPQAQRQSTPQSPFQAAFPVPAGAKDVSIQCTMPASQIISTSPVYEINLTIEYSTDGGNTYKPSASLDWFSRSDNVGRLGNPPGLNVPVSLDWTHIRGSAVIPTNMTIGLTVTVNP